MGTDPVPCRPGADSVERRVRESQLLDPIRESCSPGSALPEAGRARKLMAELVQTPE